MREAVEPVPYRPVALFGATSSFQWPKSMMKSVVDASLARVLEVSLATVEAARNDMAPFGSLVWAFVVVLVTALAVALELIRPLAVAREVHHAAASMKLSPRRESQPQSAIARGTLQALVPCPGPRAYWNKGQDDGVDAAARDGVWHEAV